MGRVSGAAAVRAGSAEQQQHGQKPPATGEKQPHGCVGRGEGAARVRGRGRSTRSRWRLRITCACSWSTGSWRQPPATPVGDHGSARAGARGGRAGARGGRARA
ncbi:hypothetical protein VPH35_030608 [Triticum aestivum]